MPRLTPAAFRRVTLLTLVALGFIIVTGAAVRLTGSGLGCPQWPNCEQGSLTPRDATSYHAMVEFVNRTITGLVSIAVIAAVLGSLRRVPRRRDLVLLSLGLVAGVLGQIVLGGLTVLFHLWPPLVMGHFALSMVLVWNAVLLHHRAGIPDEVAARVRVPEVDPDLARLARLGTVLAATVVLTGTIVTATGPHGGDEEVDRLPFELPDVARIHGGGVVLFLALSLVLMTRLPSQSAAGRAARRLLVVIAAQAAIGYTQYFTGVPVVLVGIHVLGAVLVWIAALHVDLATRVPAAAEAPADGGALAAASGAGDRRLVADRYR